MKESDFLEAIARHPESAECYSVFADWLTERGDPHGELIALQLRTTDAGARLSGGERGAEHRLLQERGEAILGPCATLARELTSGEPPLLTIEWRYGFIRAVRFDGPYDPEQHESIYGRIRRDEFLRSLLSRSCARFVERIEIADWWVARDRVFDVDLTALEAAPRSLRRVSMVPIGHRDLAGRLFSFERFLAAHPQLTELELGGESVAFPVGAHLPQLTKLAVLEHLPSFGTFAAIALSSWPSLVSLTIASSGPHYPQFQAPLESILQGAKVPSLESLSLSGAVNATWPVVTEIAGSPISWRLKHLDLSRCEIDDFGAHAFSQHRSAFANLETLNLDGNELSEDGVEAMRKLPFRVTVGNQCGIEYAPGSGSAPPR